MAVDVRLPAHGGSIVVGEARFGRLGPTLGSMSSAVLAVMHEACLNHDTGRGHPERAARLEAVRRGLEHNPVGTEVTWASPEPAARVDLERVHHPDYLDFLEQASAQGGGDLDADTVTSVGSWRAALLAAGGIPEAVRRLRQGQASSAFVAVRPPGHHARPGEAMGFCLLNNVAVGAAALAAEGERVLIVDIDAHHGNGTQEAFWTSGEVGYLSLHQWPLYPGTGRPDETGAGPGRGRTANVALPAGATGDVYLAALDEVVAPLFERLQPTWLLISAGFDAHRADPLTDLGLTAGDYGMVVRRLAGLVPAGRCIAILEGGYDLVALEACTAAAVTALAGGAEDRAGEGATSGGRGREAVRHSAEAQRRALAET
jgi:acetoin utilization deacetylase AcuC-like enzyme